MNKKYTKLKFKLINIIMSLIIIYPALFYLNFNKTLCGFNKKKLFLFLSFPIIYFISYNFIVNLSLLNENKKEFETLKKLDNQYNSLINGNDDYKKLEDMKFKIIELETKNNINKNEIKKINESNDWAMINKIIRNYFKNIIVLEQNNEFVNIKGELPFKELYESMKNFDKNNYYFIISKFNYDPLSNSFTLTILNKKV